MPDFAEAHYNLATVALNQRRPADAEAALRRALDIKPAFPAAQNNLGLLLKEQGCLDEAEAAFRNALTLTPNLAEVHNNLASVRFAKRELVEAEIGFRRAVELDPRYAVAHNNLGMALKEQNRAESAVASFRRALELDPDNVEANFNLATTLLVLGRFEEGWPRYQWRWRHAGLTEPSCGQPRWGGESLAGRTILLRAEQGIGDTIHFVRYARLLKQRGAQVVVECQPALARLFVRLPAVDRVVCPWRTAG